MEEVVERVIGKVGEKSLHVGELRGIRKKELGWKWGTRKYEGIVEMVCTL